MKWKNRKVWIIWLMMGAVIIGIILYDLRHKPDTIDVSLTEQSGGQTQDDKQEEETRKEQTANPSITSYPEPTKIIKEEDPSGILMLAGDLMCLRGQQYAAYKDKDYDFTDTFCNLAPILKEADFVIGNLETLISPSNPFTYQAVKVNGQPNCNAMYSYLEAVKKAGFDAVVTANNHCLDGSYSGITETIENLDLAGISHTGTFLTEEQPRFLLADVNGIKVAFLSYTELINGRYSIPEKDLNIMVRCYSKENVTKDAADAKALGAEYVIAYNHWGTENTEVITKQQESHAQEIADAGVDLIIGSHSHCLQAPAYITAEDGRQVLCMYSLGNLVSSMERDINQETAILEVKLKRSDDKVTAEKIEYYPLRVFPNYEGKHYVIVPLKEEIVTSVLSQEKNDEIDSVDQINEISPALKKKYEESRLQIQKIMGDMKAVE